MDFCLLPSIWPEPFSLVMLEALSFGVPLLVFKIGGTTEIIRHQYNGFIADKMEFESFRKIMMESINQSASEYSLMGENCLISAKAFSKKRKYLTLTKIFNNVAYLSIWPNSLKE